MKNILKLLIVSIGLISLASCGEGKDQNAAQAAQPKPYPVYEVPTKTVTGFTTYPASIEGIVNSEVRAKVSGYITKVLVDEGEQVKAGQILFKLETQSLSQDAAAAKANVNAAQVEVDKLKPLVEKNIISSVQLETAKAKLQQAQSGYNSILANIGYANIKSPVDGYVGAIRKREGALISASDQEPLTTVSDISKVYAYFSMNESDYLDFIQDAEGTTIQDKIDNIPAVRLKLANGSLYDQEGKIQTINSVINPNTGSISFRAIFDNPSRLLTNGNSAILEIPKTYKDVLVISQESTYEQQGNTLVFKLQNNDSVVSSIVKVKAKVDNLYVIESGVEQGDSVVAKGTDKLRSGTRISPQPVAFDSVAKPLEKVFN
ncbi:efflux RND transporter periplasmic adaptor subunit [Gillisia hiemivivida]|uniref:Efflux RND transporter periplasmic adaptor subunit n=1 Tax=Gillisia hiemivivida TaxID=291190 RepID=A0A5C6ZXC0_9FLAO|nr:efflux RND transporter periplasmic adaptor subunit [Gillisia hiemivivida]TXD93515.1 efflux RND transporter periplasmic adaptor subunit [Gillisia hiemivivida]